MRQEARGLGPTITYQLQKLGQLALNVWMDLVWKVEVQDSGVLRPRISRGAGTLTVGAERRRARRMAVVPAACSQASLQALHDKVP